MAGKAKYKKEDLDEAKTTEELAESKKKGSTKSKKKGSIDDKKKLIKEEVKDLNTTFTETLIASSQFSC